MSGREGERATEEREMRGEGEKEGKARRGKEEKNRFR